jgi:hypothetical protein
MAQIELFEDDFVRHLPEESKRLSCGIVENLVFASLGEQKNGNLSLQASQYSG